MVYPGFIAYHHKAVRHIAFKHGIHFNELNSLLICYAYHDYKNKLVRGSAIDSIAGWSGARAKWKRMIKAGLIKGIEKGFLDKVRQGRGYRVFINDKGYSVIKAYQTRIEEILNEKNLTVNQ